MQLGLTEAPVIVLGHLTEAQRRAYRIADNKLTELGSWDEALLFATAPPYLVDYDGSNHPTATPCGRSTRCRG